MGMFLIICEIAHHYLQIYRHIYIYTKSEPKVFLYSGSSIRFRVRDWGGLRIWFLGLGLGLGLGHCNLPCCILVAIAVSLEMLWWFYQIWACTWLSLKKLPWPNCGHCLEFRFQEIELLMAWFREVSAKMHSSEFQLKALNRSFPLALHFLLIILYIIQIPCMGTWVWAQ